MSPSIVGPPVAHDPHHSEPKPKQTPPLRRRRHIDSDSDSDPDCGGRYPRSCYYSSDEGSPSPPEKAVAQPGRALTYASSGDPCLDFFFQVVPGSTAAADVAALLAVAWAHDARTALKLVCHLRGVRGHGKADREGFYAAALWLHAHHPRTLAGNLAAFATFGCLKDLPELLFRLLRVPLNDTVESKVFHRRNKRLCIDKEAAAEARLQVEAQLAQTALSRYATDESFRLLYDAVADLFAEMLKSDVEHLRVGDKAKIGLAAKWCPSLRSSYDRATLLCEALARRIFPRESSQEYLNIAEKHYAYRVRDRLRREVLVPLRKALELPEVYMSAGKWKELPYAHVASVAMRRYKDAFRKQDASGVTNFFNEVSTGHAKIPTDALLPHDIIAGALKSALQDEEDEASELQWRRMVSTLSTEGRLANCIAVCSLSNGVDEPPAAAAVALGLLISELGKEPWKGRVITFDATPQLHKVRGKTLKEKLSSLANLKARRAANLQAVFDQIIRIAVDGKLPKDMMVRTVFVLSDMVFDGWAGGEWETDYDAITRKFGEAGYGEVVPEVVFWNVGASKAGASKAGMPVVAVQKGAALVSGYSKNMVKLFLERGGELLPAAVMAEAISGPEYGNLEVFD